MALYYSSLTTLNQTLQDQKERREDCAFDNSAIDFTAFHDAIQFADALAMSFPDKALRCYCFAGYGKDGLGLSDKSSPLADDCVEVLLSESHDIHDRTANFATLLFYPSRAVKWEANLVFSETRLFGAYDLSHPRRAIMPFAPTPSAFLNVALGMILPLRKDVP